MNCICGGSETGREPKNDDRHQPRTHPLLLVRGLVVVVGTCTKPLQSIRDGLVAS